MFDEDGDEVDADFFECEAYQRIWDAVDLLWLIFDNGEKMTIPTIVATLFATGRNPPMKIHYLLTWRFVS